MCPQHPDPASASSPAIAWGQLCPSFMLAAFAQHALAVASFAFAEELSCAPLCPHAASPKASANIIILIFILISSRSALRPTHSSLKSLAGAQPPVCDGHHVAIRAHPSAKTVRPPAFP